MRILSRFMLVGHRCHALSASQSARDRFPWALERRQVERHQYTGWQEAGRAPVRLRAAPAVSISLRFAVPDSPNRSCCSPICPATATPKFRAKFPRSGPASSIPTCSSVPPSRLCLALIDANIPAQESDRQLLEFLKTARPSASSSLPPSAIACRAMNCRGRCDSSVRITPRLPCSRSPPKQVPAETSFGIAFALRRRILRLLTRSKVSSAFSRYLSERRYAGRRRHGSKHSG